MNKREIIERLKDIAKHAVHTVGKDPFIMSIDDGIAVHEAIELLNKLETNCSEIPNNSDTISRQTAIDAICEDGTWLERQGRVDITMAERKQRDVDIIENLPSAQPEIIRCKDCLIHGVCRFEQGLGLNGYCSQAKRRTNG